MTATITKRTLVCELTNDELLRYGSELAGTYAKKRDAEGSKKASSAHWADEIARLDKEASILERKVSMRQEERPVECAWAYHWESGLKELVRLDIGEIVEKGQITDQERQMHAEELLVDQPPQEES